MAIDQRIQTTITAGRRSAQEFDQGPIMVILLGCLAVAMCFTTLGMGFVNIASGAAAAAGVGARAPKLTIAPLAEPAENPDARWKREDQALRKQIVALQLQKQHLADEAQVQKTAVDGELQDVSTERMKSENIKREIETIEAQKKELSAKLTEVQARLAGFSEEERRQLQLRTQLEQQLADTRREIAEAVRRIQELHESVEERRNSLTVELLRPRDGRPTTWVECARTAIVLLPQGTRVSLAELGGRRETLLPAIESRHVEFLVRPDGFQTFRAARNLAEQLGASSIGYEPIDANWRLKYK